MRKNGGEAIAVYNPNDPERADSLGGCRDAPAPAYGLLFVLA